MIHLDRLQSASQTPCYVEITEMLSTSRRELRVIGSWKKKRKFFTVWCLGVSFKSFRIFICSQFYPQYSYVIYSMY